MAVRTVPSLSEHSTIEKQLSEIDCTLSSFHLFRLPKFVYNPGDCLFDAFAVLFHFRFASLHIREGIVTYFKECLDNKDPDALHSMDTELNIDFLKELHGVDNSQIYLERMSLSAWSQQEARLFGLWGDVFCIKWLEKWLSIPICVS